MTDPKPTLAILGGTGKEGKGMAWRWAKAGYPLIIGSRQREKARRTAAEIRQMVQDDTAPVRGMSNAEAAARADIVVIAVPYAAHRPTLEAIREAMQGKILVDVTVPLVPPKVTKAQMPPAGSAALEAQQILGANVAVVDAFQNIAHQVFWEEESDCDVLVAGKGKKNRQIVMQLVEDAGFRALDAGPIENTAVIEGLTSVLIYLNKTYGSHKIGLRITGI